MALPIERIEVDKAWFCENRAAAVYRLQVIRAGGARPSTKEKRFSDFHSLHKHLAQRFGEPTLAQAGVPPFPSKKLMGNRDANLIESRRHHFERFMQACVATDELRGYSPFDNFVGQPPSEAALRVRFDPETGSELRVAGADEHILYTFDVFVGDKRVDTFQARYSREAARHREMTRKGLLQRFVPPLEFPPANHIKDMTRDPQRIAERGAAMQQYYQRLLTEGGEELRAKLGCSAEELRSSLSPRPLEPEPEPQSMAGGAEPEPELEPEPEPEQVPVGEGQVLEPSAGGGELGATKGGSDISRGILLGLPAGAAAGAALLGAHCCGGSGAAIAAVGLCGDLGLPETSVVVVLAVALGTLVSKALPRLA